MDPVTRTAVMEKVEKLWNRRCETVHQDRWVIGPEGRPERQKKGDFKDSLEEDKRMGWVMVGKDGTKKVILVAEKAVVKLLDPWFKAKSHGSSVSDFVKFCVVKRFAGARRSDVDFIVKAIDRHLDNPAQAKDNVPAEKIAAPPKNAPKHSRVSSGEVTLALHPAKKAKKVEENIGDETDEDEEENNDDGEEEEEDEVEEEDAEQIVARVRAARALRARQAEDGAVFESVENTKTGPVSSKTYVDADGVERVEYDHSLQKLDPSKERYSGKHQGFEATREYFAVKKQEATERRENIGRRQ
ncbi:hypothetical protein BDZ45DRAFT_685261 [Acephala macrosclerotiorum]|nr:hypothetical protein BDZ45DRAFT_685261 [Acephala macrosclerotiorum]